MNEGPGAGVILIAIFLILFGLCIALLGGGCTIFWLYAVASGASMTDSGTFLMIGLVTFAIGVALIWVSVNLLRGKYRNNPSAPPAPPPPPSGP